MSGLPPPGMRHFVSTLRVRISTTEILPSPQFEVYSHLDAPGAAVQLAGVFKLRQETLDFSGTLFMDAKISETQTGFTRVLLKAIDPLFRKDGGGSAIPIRIQGKRDDPSFGLDKRRVFKRGRQSCLLPAHFVLLFA